MRFKCKTCQSEIIVQEGEVEVVCSICGRKHTVAELKADAQAELSAKAAETARIRHEIDQKKTALQNAQSIGDEAQNFANYAMVSIIGVAVSFIVLLAFGQSSDTILTMISMVLTVSLFASIYFLRKLANMDAIPDETLKSKTAGVWFIEFLFVPWGVIDGIRTVNMVKNYDPNARTASINASLTKLNNQLNDAAKEEEELHNNLQR